MTTSFPITDEMLQARRKAFAEAVRASRANPMPPLPMASTPSREA